ncbi:MAG TPA: LptF/LptG family permease [Phycisphaerae bacterium]
MRILDRYILKSFLVNYFLAMGVLMGMYVLLDLIVNVQGFARGAAPPPPNRPAAVSTSDPAPSFPPAPADTLPAASKPAPADYQNPSAATQIAPSSGAPAISAWTIVEDMVDYYSYQLLEIFQQISGIIPILAAGFTMVRMTRHNELTAMLASGVSLYRVAAPIILLSMAFSAIHVLNQEYVISQPFIIEKLLRKHDEVNQVSVKNEPLFFIKDSDGSLLSAKDYDPSTKKMTGVFIVERSDSGMPIRHTVADSAEWGKSPAGDGIHEAWILHNVRVEDDTGPARDARTVDILVRDTGLTPEQIDLILSKKAVDFLSSERVRELAKYSPDVNKPLLYKIMHLRFTQPLMNIIMLLIGIPFLLTREPSRLIVNMVYCTIVSGAIFVATFVIFQMGGTQLDPLWAAWLPVLIFGPFSLVMMDTIKT